MRLRTKRLTLLICSLMLVLLLTACGGSGSSGSGNSGGSTPTSAPVTNPTPTTPAVSLTTFTGEGYTIGYPSGWKANKSGNIASLADPSGKTVVTITTTPNPNGVASASTAVQGGLTGGKSQLTNVKSTTVPATTTIAGDTWQQGAETGNLTGQTTPSRLVVLADNHPASSTSTRLFIIVLIAPDATYDQTNSSTFQPMLQSFKFV